MLRIVFTRVLLLEPVLSLCLPSGLFPSQFPNKLYLDFSSLQPEARLRMCGAIPQLPQYVLMAWYLVKHKNNFTLHLSHLSHTYLYLAKNENYGALRTILLASWSVQMAELHDRGSISEMNVVLHLKVSGKELNIGISKSAAHKQLVFRYSGLVKLSCSVAKHYCIICVPWSIGQYIRTRRNLQVIKRSVRLHSRNFKTCLDTDTTSRCGGEDSHSESTRFESRARYQSM